MFDELLAPRVVPMSADEVFLVMQRLIALDDPNYMVTPQTTLDDLFAESICFEDPGDMVAGVQGVFGVQFSKARWREVLKPEKQRTLRDVCELVATRATRNELVPYSILGRECRSAGAFCLVRAMLQAAGANVAALAPSSPLEPYLRDYPRLFDHHLQLATLIGLPLLKVWHPVFSKTGRFLLLLAAVFAVCVLLLYRGVGLEMLPWVALSCLAAPLAWLIVGSMVPKRFCRYSLGALATVRDLCMAIAAADGPSPSTAAP
jgi:hypothetical protein